MAITELITPEQVERLDRFFKEKIETDEDYRKLGRDFPGENFFVLQQRSEIDKKAAEKRQRKS